jgi:integrative and conjugative element protein (TIGR02256 family)
MQIVFSNRAYLAIITETAEKIKTEAGGVFLGCYENGTWYVIETIDPGPNSIFHVAYFEYDKKYITHLINKIARLYQSKLTLIGLWHRHPGSFDQFSTTDAGTNSDYAKLSPHGAISVLVNIDPLFRLTPYHVALPLRYTKIPYQVGDNLIPQHLLQQKEAEQSVRYVNGYADKSYSDKSTASKPKIDFVRLLDGVKPKFEPVEVCKEDFRPEEAEKHRDTLIDSLLDDITYFSETRGLALNVEQNKGSLCLSHKGANNTITKVSFTYIAHKGKIVFSYEGDVCYAYTPGMFAGLLADYSPPESTFKTGLLNAMGNVLGFGKDTREEDKHE